MVKRTAAADGWRDRWAPAFHSSNKSYKATASSKKWPEEFASCSVGRPQWDLVVDVPAIWPRRLVISGQMDMGQKWIPYKLDGKVLKIKHLTSPSDVLWFENKRLYVYVHIYLYTQIYMYLYIYV